MESRQLSSDAVRIVRSAQGPIVETDLWVRFAETDAMGVVYHTNYIIWFEVGRGAYWRALGLGEVHALRDAGAFPVAHVEAHYHAPARYGDRVTVRTRVAEVRSRSVTFAYECLGEAGTRLVTGQTTHLFIDASGRAVRLPDALRRALAGEACP